MLCVVKVAAGNVSLVFRERQCLESSKEIVFMALHIGSGGDMHVESSGSSMCITVRGLERSRITVRGLERSHWVFCLHLYESARARGRPRNCNRECQCFVL